METERRKVLLIDDEPINIQFVSNILKNDYTIIFATNGPEGLEQAAKALPDLILLDLVMEGMDGYEVITRLRQDPLTQPIPVIFLTGRTEIAEEAKGLQLGAADYITKPISPPILQARVKNHMDLAHALKNSLEAKERAESATELKDKFVSLVAHDLRAPIGAVIEMLFFVQEEGLENLKEFQKEMIGKSIRRMEDLIKLIEEVLDITQLQTGKIKIEKKVIDIYEATFSALTLKPSADKKGISLKNEVPDNFRVYADPTLFGQVIQNLISNAIKFSNPGDTITLSVDPNDRNTLLVKDTGQGMAPQLIENLFRHDTKTSTPGTAGERGSGLGLPLSQDIMRAMGGQLRVESQPGKGTTFYVSLPPWEPLILVVDDSKTVRQAIQQQLNELNTKVIEADNGQEALKILQNQLPALIISNLNMPLLDGFQLLDALKANRIWAQIPVILATEDTMEDKEKAFQYGAVDFVTKPISPTDLLPRIKRFLL